MLHRAQNWVDNHLRITRASVELDPKEIFCLCLDDVGPLINHRCHEPTKLTVERLFTRPRRIKASWVFPEVLLGQLIQLLASGLLTFKRLQLVTNALISAVKQQLHARIVICGFLDPGGEVPLLSERRAFWSRMT